MKRSSSLPITILARLMTAAASLAWAPLAANAVSPVRVVPETVQDDSALTLVNAPSATVSAVSDHFRLLVIGSRDGQLHVFPLAPNGAVEDARSTTLDLPKSGAGEAAAARPFSLLFHPRLPLLYVWQNLAREVPQQAHEALPHLLVYRCDGQRLQLVASVTQGPDYPYQHQSGMLAMDDRQGRLFIPTGNGGPKKALPSIGYYALTAQGLPVQEAGTQRPEPVMVSHPINTFHSFVPGPGGSSVLVGAVGGALSVDMEGRQVARQTFLQDGGAILEVAAHPYRPLYYFLTSGGGILCAMEHVNGHLTQLPRVLTIESAKLRNRPVVMAARNQIALAGQRSVMVFDLDQAGWPVAKAREYKVAEIEGEATPLAYSEKFNRLYIPVK